MLEQVRAINLQSPQEITRLTEFLLRFSLHLDEVDYGVMIEERQNIVGVCCKLRNVLKCFAIDPNFQGEGITSLLLTELNYRVFEEGYLHTFIFTKPIHRILFESLGFEVVVRTNEVCLLEKGLRNIQATIAQLKTQYQLNQGPYGSIVMNANPFTLGHLYLIEAAAKQCQKLIVFVVEEDASSFPFVDRLRLVEQGTAHLDCVRVVPSSAYCISRTTFPNYFIRDQDHAFASYARVDATIFGQWFGETLHITKRFVGEEPLDPMTASYNVILQDVLPTYGTEVIVIPRLNNQDGIVSASKVRHCLKTDRLLEVEQSVPPSTLAYLQQADAVIARLKQHDGNH